MAGQAKRLFELDASNDWSESRTNGDTDALTPHLKVARSVKDAFHLLIACKFRAADFLKGMILHLMNLPCTSSHSLTFSGVCSGLEILSIYLGNILKFPTNIRYFAINTNNRIYRRAFEGFELEVRHFLLFLGSCPQVLFASPHILCGRVRFSTKFCTLQSVGLSKFLRPERWSRLPPHPTP
jgi:hypothetical protein